ncbi:MAG: hypothetical protein HY811_04045 [Planctomycetes bacterium]|nr:hypothetical protein [Planctomycetota bacterium]
MRNTKNWNFELWLLPPIRASLAIGGVLVWLLLIGHWNLHADTWSQTTFIDGTFTDVITTQNNAEVILSVFYSGSNESDGALIVDGTTAGNNTVNGVLIPGGPFNSGNPLIIDTVIPRANRIYNFTCVTLQNNAIVSHSQAVGAGTGYEGVEFRVSATLFIDSTSKIELTEKGYTGGTGGGAGNGIGGGAGASAYTGASGGGYGGEGGNGASNGGITYGASSSVAYMGSGGGHNSNIGGRGGHGGGRIVIKAMNVNIAGSIQANGGGAQGGKNGGGSGGGIYIYAKQITLSGILSAAGGGGGYYSSQSGAPGNNGTGGAGTTVSNTPGSPGIGGKGGNAGSSNPAGPSAGAGGWPGDAGAGGGAGRIAIYYETFNGDLVNGGVTNYSNGPGASSNKIGPYAYWTYLPPSSVTSGVYISSVISIAELSSWGILTYTHTAPSSTTFSIDVLRAIDNYVFATNVASGSNLANVIKTPTYAIKLRANFTTENTTKTPTLSDWTVNYAIGGSAVVTTTNWTDLVNGNPVKMGASIAHVKFDMKTFDGTALWKRFRIDKGLKSYANLACPDSKIEVQVWCENTGNGFWDIGDTFISKGNFNNSTCYLNMKKWQVTTTPKTYYIVYKLSGDIGGGQRAGVKIVDSSYLEFENATCIGVP